ncbi:MAG: aspartate--tRNA(Asn) ligase [Clostridia bacterium]|nr:aspartate--tRNA(Asn) ligase [Clostridia bacterium]
MERIRIENLEFEKQCKIGGFVEKLRDTKYMVFIVLRDISGKIQVSIDKQNQANLVEDALKAVQGSCITVVGKLQENPYVKQGGKEFVPESLTVESVAAESPIDENSNIDQRLDYRWLDLRQEKNQLIFKVQTLINQSFREYLIEKNFVEIHTPKLIGAASESGADVFELKYFDRKAYLAQSPQFYKQMAMASGFENVFECGPVFRAEKSHTSKHTTEFTGFDIEMSYINSFYDVMKTQEGMLTYMLEKVNAKYGEEIKELFGVEVIVPKKPFPIMKLCDIYAELEKRYGYKVPESEKEDLTTDAEKLCKDLAKEMYDSEFLFVTDYGASKRAFYHMRKDGVPQGYDLIWKGCEITTGAQREHRYEVLKKQAEEKGLNKDVEFYLEFFKYGCPAHGGFALGVDRITMLLLETNSLKETMFLFRGPNRITP